jgi:hypothetical protein
MKKIMHQTSNEQTSVEKNIIRMEVGKQTHTPPWEYDMHNSSQATTILHL